METELLMGDLTNLTLLYVFNFQFSNKTGKNIIFFYPFVDRADDSLPSGYSIGGSI